MLPLTEPEIQQFTEQLGRMLLRLPLVSAAVGHKWALGTIKDYLRPHTPESEFLIDLFSQPIPQVLLKWYPRNGPLFSHPDCNVQSGPSTDDLRTIEKGVKKTQ